MQHDSNNPPLDNIPPLGSPPPLIPEKTNRNAWSGSALSILLSLCLGLFLADAVVSFLDDSLILFFSLHVLAGLRGILFLFALLSGVLVYVLMGFTPMIPKRWFLPVTLFNPVALLLIVPLAIFFFGQMQQISWVISLLQVVVGLTVLYWIQGGLRFRWPLVAVSQLGTRGFSWLNLSAFAAVNLFVLLPAVLGYFAVCFAVAVNHFSDGFLALRPSGLAVDVRKYARADGKTIQLVPMAHIGDAAFYQKLSQTFPTNATILMEGVTDNQNLLTNKITYKRMATSLGLSEQQKEFKPEAEMVMADVDVSDFSTNTIDLLNLIMLVHGKGVNEQTLLQLTQYSPPPHFEKELFDDLVRKRNRHLLGEINSQLSETDHIIVPWGAAHIPEIAKEIQKTGFRLQETQEFMAIRFGATDKKQKRADGK